MTDRELILRFRAHLVREGLTQVQAARALGIHRHTLSSAMRAHRPLSPGLRRAIERLIERSEWQRARDAHCLVLGRVSNRRGADSEQTAHELARLVSRCNDLLAPSILRPYTVLRGEEIQGVAASLLGAVESIDFLDRAARLANLAAELRFVVLSRSDALFLWRAHEVIGPGLSHAQRTLSQDRRRHPRVRFLLEDRDLGRNLERLWAAADGLSRRWKPEDLGLISDMLRIRRDDEVGRIHGKNQSQVWKRRRTLLIEEHRAIRDVLFDLAASSPHG